MGVVPHRPVLIRRGGGARRGPGAFGVAALAAALLVALPSGRALHRGAEPEANADASAPARAGGAATGGFPTIAILCYHDVTDDAGARLDAVAPDSLRAQIRRAKANGWTFVSLSALAAAREHPETLPARTLVLTFDDGYRSFATRVLPILREEQVPATAAIVSDFVDHPPDDAAPIMSWKQIVEVDAADEVEIASHTHGLHVWTRGNPQGGSSPSVTTRRYVTAENAYEDRDAYETRIRRDMELSRRILRNQLGHDVDVLVWPYGEHNARARAIAAEAGFTLSLALGDRRVTREDLKAGVLPRYMVHRGAPIAMPGDGWLEPPAPAIRAAQADLDAVWDEDAEVFERNVERLVAQIQRVGATHVFLQACPDPRGDGFFAATWFVNHQAPVRADVWSHVAARLKRAGLRVWVRAPSMNLSWAWQRHREWRIPFHGSRRGTRPWYFRVSPDVAEAREAALDFFGDVAVYLPIDGILFDDDAYMLPGERLRGGGSSAAEKSAAMRDYLEAIKGVVRQWRPGCKFARNLYAPVVERSGIQPTFAQELEETLQHDDLAVVMAYAHMEEHAGDAARWTGALARAAARRWHAAARVPARSRGLAPPPILFKLQAYDWAEESWVPGEALVEMAREARRGGIEHLGVYPVLPNEGEMAEGLLTTPASAAAPGAAPSRQSIADTP